MKIQGQQQIVNIIFYVNSHKKMNDHQIMICNISFIVNMNSSQLLNVLNKQSHNKHKAGNRGSQFQPIKHNEMLESLKENQFSQIDLPIKVPSPPDFLVQILQEQKKAGVVSKITEEQIAKLRKQKQKNVFLAYNQSHIAFLSQLNVFASQKNEYASKCITDVMARRFNLVTGDLENGSLIINHDRALNSKDQIQQLAQLDRARLLKIKDGAIRSKMDLLNSKMREMEQLHQSPKHEHQALQEVLNKKIQENLDISGYGLQSQKTKIAKDYVKFMSEQRRDRRKREQQRQQKRHKYEMQRQAQLKQAESMRDLAKKQQMLQKIEQKRRKRDEQQKNFTQKEQKIAKFLQKYRQQMPVFKKKQKQYVQKFIKPQKAYREEKLKQIKQKKKSYSLNDIIDHQKKYEQIKRKQMQRKQTEKQLYLKSIKVNTKQYYKGSLHDFVQKMDKQSRQKNIALYQLGKNRYQKMLDYSKVVKEQFKPKINEDKRIQFLKLLEEKEMKKKKMIKKYRPVINSDGEDIGVETFYEQKKQGNRYRDGNKFMEQGNLKRRKNVSQSVDVEKTQNELTPQSVKLLKKKESAIPQRGKSQKELWEIRSKQIIQMSNNLSSPKQFEQVKVNFENLDRKAAEKQTLMKHARMSAQQHMEQKGALDQFYLESIKNKIKLLQ